MALPEVDFLTWSIGAGDNAMSQADYAVNPAQSSGVSVGLADPTLYNKAQRQSAFVTSTLAMLMAAVTNNPILDDGNVNEFWKNLWETFLAASFFDDTGSVNAWATAAPYGLAFDGPFNGLRVTLEIGHTITGPVTFSWMGASAVPVVYSDGVALKSGEVLAGAIVDLSYFGGNWQLVSLTRELISNTTRTRNLAAANYYTNFATGVDLPANGTSGAPWKTLQYAWGQIAQGVDGGGLPITINQAGVDTGGLIATGAIPGCPVLSIVTAGINTGNNIGIWATEGANLSISGSGTVTALEYDLVADKSSVLSYSGITLGPCTIAKVYSTQGASININGSYEDNGSAVAHWASDTFGSIFVKPPLPGPPATISVAGNPTYSGAWAQALTGGVIQCPQTIGSASNLVFAGNAVTGKRYNITTGSGVNTNGAGASFLPGSISGTNDGTSWYA
jgi:hypothetical protein